MSCKKNPQTGALFFIKGGKKMENTVLNIGIDVGNYDTKSQHTVTPSSFVAYDLDQLIAEEELSFGRKYYVPTNERNCQEKDKTLSEHALIMTLFGIAKEVIAQVEREGEPLSCLQQKIDEVTHIRLGVGLPVGFFSELSQKTHRYYTQIFSNGVCFAYKGKSTGGQYVYFNITSVDKVGVYPQDVIGVIRNPKLTIPQATGDYYIIGIGGGTLDLIPMSGGPQVQNCVSLARGTTEMYKAISSRLQQNGFGDKDYKLIENVLLGKRTYISEEERKMIVSETQNYANKIINDLQNRGLKLGDYPSVFIGGGALLLRKYFEESGVFVKTEFVENVRENAVYYAKAVAA